MALKNFLILFLSKLLATLFMLYYFVISLPILNLIDRFFYSVSSDEPDRNKLPEQPPYKHDLLQIPYEKTQISLHYVTLENSDNTKPLLLFVHGFPENWYTWRHQMKRFAAEYYVVAIDMRGYNFSSKPKRRSDYALKHLTEDLRLVITSLYRSSPNRDVSEQPKCTLVAHDWGGAVAWDFVTKHPEYVEKFIVMNIPNAKLMFKNLQTNAAQVKRSWYIYFFQLPFLPERYICGNNAETMRKIFTTQLVHKENITDSDVSEFQHSALQKGASTAMINYYRNVFTLASFRDQVAKSRSKIPVKTLMIWGERDVALGKELTYGTDRYVEDITIRYVPDASHWVQQDTPDLVNEIMAEFLRL